MSDIARYKRRTFQIGILSASAWPSLSYPIQKTYIYAWDCFIIESEESRSKLLLKSSFKECQSWPRWRQSILLGKTGFAFSTKSKSSTRPFTWAGWGRCWRGAIEEFMFVNIWKPTNIGSLRTNSTEFILKYAWCTNSGNSTKYFLFQKSDTDVGRLSHKRPLIDDKR